MATYPIYPFHSLAHFLLSGLDDTNIHHPLYVDSLTGATITAGHFKKLVNGLNSGLQKMGFRKGDCLSVFSSNNIYTNAIYTGTLAACGVVSPINVTYTGQELEYQLSISKPKILIAHPDQLDLALEYATKLGIQHVYSIEHDPRHRVPFWVNALVIHNSDTPMISIPEEALRHTPAFALFSSGTTGRSKCVHVSHYQYISNMIEAKKAREDPNQPNALVGVIGLGVMPMYHAAGLFRSLQLPLLILGTLVVVKKYSVENVCQAVETYKINHFAAVPPMLLHMLNSPITEKYDLSSITSFTVGAAPISGKIVEGIVAKYKAPVVQGYGLTECGPIITQFPFNSLDKPSSIGVPIPYTHVRIVDENGKDLGVGQCGELIVKGPQLMMGYYGNPTATKETIDEDGYLHTGDIALYDEDGYYYIVDRIKELIKYKGLQVAPVELESVLSDCPFVLDSGVIGIYNEQQATELPMAFIVPRVPKDDLLGKKIMDWVSDRVAPHKRLRGGVLFVDEIPRSAAGKIQRKQLKTLYQQMMPLTQAKL
ncbi:uncharacterized protein BX664DRAFT_140194 [Halteromyces radiatus]|uniref:uncharacterized protein n=1 Tax=Halteromyces radiatus TaxID=101107 RepID=UPI002220E543|nr:uncharacterized protein BX664DRAFT_140194 [Halteromyces radiatus]KAI8089721.1 hypothetical protein BX664DRAFT_140194 [Halteromyces radiatus]